jgi:hypothetical protein
MGVLPSEDMKEISRMLISFPWTVVTLVEPLLPESDTSGLGESSITRAS